MQKRVLPFAFALRAASNTGSISRRREALVAVVYLDDCEQYEPDEREHGPDRRQSGAALTIFATAPTCKSDSDQLNFRHTIPKKKKKKLTFDVH